MPSVIFANKLDTIDHSFNSYAYRDGLGRSRRLERVYSHISVLLHGGRRS